MIADWFEIIGGILMALVSGVMSVIWRKADRAEKLAEQNAMMLTHLARHSEKTGELTERLSSLEASFQAEIKNLSVTLKRLESAVMRLYQDNHPRAPHEHH